MLINRGTDVDDDCADCAEAMAEDTSRIERTPNTLRIKTLLEKPVRTTNAPSSRVLPRPSRKHLGRNGAGVGRAQEQRLAAAIVGRDALACPATGSRSRTPRTRTA